MLVAQLALQPLQRFSKKEVPEAASVEEILALQARCSIVALKHTTPDANTCSAVTHPPALGAPSFDNGRKGGCCQGWQTQVYNGVWFDLATGA